MKCINMVVLGLLFWTTGTLARVVVISDIDDTIKQSNSASTLGQVYYFYTMKSYPAMAYLYQDMQSYYRDVTFYYVSAAFDFMYEQEQWLDRQGFPWGLTFLRERLHERTYEHKYETITALLKGLSPQDQVFFFGDNSSHDPQVYLDVVRALNLKKAHIYIRDVTLMAHDTGVGLPTTRLPGVSYFLAEHDLFPQLANRFVLSRRTRQETAKLFKRQVLIPEYTHRTLARLMRHHGFCERPRPNSEQAIVPPCPAAERFFFHYYRQ